MKSGLRARVNTTERISGEQISTWLERLEQDPANREISLQLWRLGPESIDAVPLLIARLNDRNSRLRDLSARWLGQTGKKSVAAADALTRAFRDEAGALRTSALIAIGEVGILSDEILRLLRAELASNDEKQRVYAARSLLLLLPTEMEALQVLRSAHTSQDYVVRSWAASSLVELFPVIPRALSDAIDFLDDWEQATVEDTARGLAGQSAEVVLPLLLGALRKPDPALRAGVLLAISEFGVRARGFRTEIADTLLALHAFQDSSSTIRRRAANVAQSAQLNFPAIAQKLGDLLDDSDGWVAEQAALALLSFKNMPGTD
jgi:HEAT repeat protein